MNTPITGKTSYREFPETTWRNHINQSYHTTPKPHKPKLKLYEKPNIIGKMYLHVELC